MSFSKVHKIYEAIQKSAPKSIDIVLKSAQKLLNCPKNAQKSIDIILKSAQKSLRLS